MTRAIPPFPPPPLRVLVVDDDADVRASLRALLRVWGHQVCEAESAAEALRVAPAFGPEVALLDAALPDGDGLELAARLRAVAGLERLAVVALTGQPVEERLQRAREADAIHHLLKPADPVALRCILGAIRYGS